MLSIEPLEPRDCAAAHDAGGGLVAFDSGATVAVFGPSYAGGVNVATDPVTGDVYYGPQPGGGPVLGHRDRNGDPVENDRYEGDPASREGLVPVLVGAAAAPPRAYPTAFGPADGPGVYTVFVEDESGRSPAVLARLGEGLADAFAPAGDVRFVTARPDADPTTYATVVLGAPLGWYGAPILGVSELGGVANAAAGLRSPSAYVAGLDPAVAPVRLVAHEVGHLLGLGHAADRRDAMYPEDLPGPTAFLGDEPQRIHDAAAAARAAAASRGALAGMTP